MDLKKLFDEWNVAEATTQEFIDNQITIDGLAHLTDQDLKDLVPLIGPRNDLKRKIAALKDSSGFNKDSSGFNSNRLNLNKDQSDMLNDILQEVSDQNAETTAKDNDIDGNASHSNNSGDEGSDSNRSEPETLGNKSRSEDSSRKSRSEDSSRKSRSKDSSEKSRTKKTDKTSRFNSSFHSYDLKEVLDSAGGAGDLILTCYKTNGSLNDTHRASLARIIISKEISGDFNKCVTKERAEFLAQEVVKLFPSELLSTWYRTQNRSHGKGKIVKGRLIRRFYTQRKGFKRVGAIGHTESDDDDDDDNESEERDLGSDVDDDAVNTEKEALAWLTNRNLSPWTRVLSAWKDTSRKRLRELQEPVFLEQEEPQPQVSGKGKGKQKAKRKKLKTTDDKVMGYTEKFPQMAEPQGWALFEVDFEYLQKQSIFKLDTSYEKLEKFVVRKLQELDRDKLFDDFYLKPQSERSAFIFLSLAELFPVGTVAVYQKKTWRPSRQEMRDSFLLQVTSFGDLQTKLAQRRKKLQLFNVTAQPLAIIIKEKEKDKIKYKSLVKFDNFEYTGLESPLKAIDIVFKSYHALHANYPAESEVMWLFLQKAIYQFSSKWDKQHDAVDRLVAEFKNFQV